MAQRIEPKFTKAQTAAVRVALSWAGECEDGQLIRVIENARKELDRAQREKEARA